MVAPWSRSRSAVRPGFLGLENARSRLEWLEVARSGPRGVGLYPQVLGQGGQPLVSRPLGSSSESLGSRSRPVFSFPHFPLTTAREMCYNREW
jgi:hypothetical protein